MSPERTPTQGRGQSRPRRRRAKIILLGDSITQLSFNAVDCGFGAHLADAYQRRADVINRGFSGYNTDWFLELIETPVGAEDVFGPEEIDPNVILVTIFFGANDASDPIQNPHHHVPIERYVSNLRQIASIAKAKCPNARILLITPPPVDHEGRLRYQLSRYGEKALGELERTLELSGRYAHACEELANELGCPCLNLWKAMQIGGDHCWTRFFVDGLHFSRKGNELVSKLLIDVIFEKFPELEVKPCEITGQWANSGSKSGEEIEKLGPWHDEIDHTNVTAAFIQEFNYVRKATGRDEVDGKK